MKHNARVLCPKGSSEIVQEMELANVEPPGVRHMSPKAEHFLMKLEKIRCPIAHILKESFLSKGGDAAISRDVITASVKYTDCILMGTRKQFQQVTQSLMEQGFGCDKLANEIRQAIRNFEDSSAASTPDISLPECLQAMYGKLGKKTLIMGILNVTPDSFSDGGDFFDPSKAVARAREMVEQGADMIDVGGESSRPGSDPVSVDEELRRVIPVIKAVAGLVDVPVSIDTCKAEVAKAAFDAGALIVNDITAATFDPDMPAFIAKKHCPAILMHMKGSPKTMQQQPAYEDLIGEVYGFLSDRVQALVDLGVDERLLMLDPGIGFGKTIDHNLQILRRLREFRSLGRPLLVGTSRKATIGEVLGDLPVQERMEGTAATVAIAIANGVDIVRVHDVKEIARVARMSDAIIRERHEK